MSNHSALNTFGKIWQSALIRSSAFNARSSEASQKE